MGVDCGNWGRARVHVKIGKSTLFKAKAQETLVEIMNFADE
jgi:malic enzyme